MACLDNLIGVAESCSTTVPDSGRYINELPYLSIEVAEAIVTQEDKSGVDLLEDKITLAENEVYSDFRNRLLPRTRMISVLQNDRIGTYPTTRETVAPSSGNQKGIRIDITRAAYLAFYINTITLFLDATETVTAYLYDLLTGETLDTFTIEAVANEPTVLSVAKAYETKTQFSRLALVYESTGNSYRTSVHPTYSGCRSCRTGKAKNRYAYFQGVTIPASGSKVYTNADGIDNTAGLTIDYSLQCTVNPFICNMKNLLVEPLLYKASEIIMREVKTSRRLNSIVMLHDDDVDHLLEYYTELYERKMEYVLNLIELPNDLCFRNNSRVQYRQRIP